MWRVMRKPIDQEVLQYEAKLRVEQWHAWYTQFVRAL